MPRPPDQLDHAPGAGAPCPVRRLLGRRVRAAAARAAAAAARSGACSCWGRSRAGRSWPWPASARRRGAGGAAAADALGPDHHRLRPPAAAQARAGRPAAWPRRDQSPGPDPGARARRRGGAAAAAHDRRGPRARRRRGRAHRRARHGAAAARARRAGRGPCPCRPCAARLCGPRRARATIWCWSRPRPRSARTGSISTLPTGRASRSTPRRPKLSLALPELGIEALRLTPRRSSPAISRAA